MRLTASHNDNHNQWSNSSSSSAHDLHSIQLVTMATMHNTQLMLLSQQVPHSKHTNNGYHGN